MIEQRLAQIERRLDAALLNQPSPRDARPHGLRNGRWCGKLTSALAAGGTATADIWIWNISDGEFQATTHSIEGVVSFTGEAYADETEVILEYIGNVWVCWQAAPGGGERDYGRVKIQNVTGKDLVAGQTVRIGKPLIDPLASDNDWAAFLAEPFMEARAASIRPSDYYQYRNAYDYMHEDQRRFAVLTEDVANGQTGYAVVSGVVAAYVYCNHQQHTRVRPRAFDDTYQLETVAEDGEGVILWMAPDVAAGNFRKALVNLSGPPIIKKAYLAGNTYRELTTGTVAYPGDCDQSEIYIDYTGYNDGGGTYLFTITDNSHQIKVDNFYAEIDTNGNTISSSYFESARVMVSGTYLLNCALHFKTPKAEGITSPETLELYSQESTYELYLFRRRNGAFERMKVFYGTHMGRRVVIGGTREVSASPLLISTLQYGYVPEVNSSVNHLANNQSQSRLVTLQQGDIIFFGIAASIEPSFAEAGEAGTWAGDVDQISCTWKFNLDFELVLVDATNYLTTYPAGVFTSTDFSRSAFKEVSVGTGDGDDAYRFDFATMEMFLLHYSNFSITTAGGTEVRPFNRFNSFSEKTAEKTHDLGSDTLKWMLSNTAPSASNTVKSNITEISAGNGYSAGGHAATISSSAQTSGIYKQVLANTTITASGGSIGPFRYAVLYNDTATNDELIGWIDYGSSISVADGGTLTIVPPASASGGSLTIG